MENVDILSEIGSEGTKSVANRKEPVIHWLFSYILAPGYLSRQSPAKYCRC